MKRWRLLLWLGLSVACFVVVLHFWPRRAATASGRHDAGNVPAAAAKAYASLPGVPSVQRTVQSASTAPSAMLPPPGLTNNAAAAAREAHLKYRLSNTALTVGQLSRSDRAILLANASIDSSGPVNLAIPDALRSKGDPGSYIVQARGPVDNAFRARLKGAGAGIVAYIPNNAFLVRASADAAKLLGSLPGTQTVLPFEPYYKLDSTLLALAVEQKPLPPGRALNLVVFGDARDAVVNALNQSGAEIVAEQPSPFGPVLTIHPAASSLATLAGWPGVQAVELASPRAPANDLSRSTIGVALDSITTNSYLGLSGQNVFVSVNDSGVDASHPDLVGRVFGFPVTDLNGHGTHVAGIIAGSGLQSTTVINALGSFMPPVDKQFRGMAPSANLFAQSTGLSDFDLQVRGARTNALISNNSWNYGSFEYDIFAASYDAAVRDSLPQVPGSQAVQYVFSAGNSGFGSDGGLGGAAGTILSPATAKNVITVGAIELARGVSNVVTVVHTDSTNTGTPWLGETDSGVQVTGFSSRGNVGIGVEGDFGRFKPDVVAPGTFVVSTTWQDPAHWDMASYYNPTNSFTDFSEDQVVETNTLNPYAVGLPDTAVRLDINVSSTNASLHFPIYASTADFPTTADFIALDSTSYPGNGQPLPAGKTLFYAIGNPTNFPVGYNVSATVVFTNDIGDYFQVLSNLNADLGPYYRYETGTSMAAAEVSGLLALIADFYTNQLHLLPPSPALMKALVINGARSVNDLIYDLQVANSIDYQGWGLVALTNSLPPGLTNGLSGQANGAPMLIFDQNPTNALATGDRQTFIVTADPIDADQPLRVTLVWTDPPGNPAAGIKLVNDLDLIVTNLESHAVFYGNDIPTLADFNTPWDTNGPATLDTINNVENVYLQSSASSSGYSITVIGHRVNVNAVTANSNNVAQDYALVISCGSGLDPTALKLQPTNPLTRDNTPNATGVTNEFANVETAPGEGIAGALLLNQHVGASSPLFGTNEVVLGSNTMWGVQGTNGLIVLGVTNQWHFYLLTNTTTFTNAAFATFLPPTLALPRMGVTNVDDPENATRVQADIDLYVSRGNPGLLSLDSATVVASKKSLSRGGDEVVTFADAQAGEVFYVGVKAEDQEAAEYAFFGVFSEQPFSQTDSNGVETIRGINVPAVIPDGTAAHPGRAQIIAIGLQSITIRRVVVTNIISHENLGDLFGQLKHGAQAAVLNNHTFGNANFNQMFIYEDNGENDVPGSQPTDGPDRLTKFAGQEGSGLWLLTEVDSAIGHTGRVEHLFIRLDPEAPPGNGATILNIQPNSFGFLTVEVPPEATNMTICVANISSTPLPVQLFVRKDLFPTLTNFDYTMTINPPGGCLSISTTDLPPLTPGLYVIGVYNPNGIAQKVAVTVTLGLSVKGVPTLNFSSTAPVPILDDAVAWSSILVTNNQKIVRCEVGVAIDHPRISDLVLTLLSPGGKRILLYENRGGPDTANLGGGGLVTNFFGTQVAGGFTANTNVIGPVPTKGTLIIDYDFFTVPDSMDVYYDGATIFTTSGLINGSGTITVPYGPGNANDITIVMNQGDNTNNPGTAWIYTPRVVAERFNYFLFSENTNFSKLPLKYAVDLQDRGTNYTLSDFEPPIAAGEYIGGPVYLGGWLVDTNLSGGPTNQFGGFLSNQVSIVDDPLTAKPPGSQFLALGAGIISTNLTVIPANNYILSFDYRGPGILGWWRGESASTAVDYAGGNNGILTNGASFALGMVNEAFRFDDALQQSAQIPYSTNLITPQYSVDAWIEPQGPVTDLVNNQALIFGQSFGHLQLVVRPGTNGVVAAWQFGTNQSDFFAVVSTGELPFNEFTHLAGTWDGVTLRLYVNGVLNNQSTPGAVPTDSGCSFFIGGFDDPSTNSCQVAPSQFFHGLIDELSLYGRALSPTEIKAIYNAGSAGKFDRLAAGEPNAPSNIANALAKAQVSLVGLRSDAIFGNNTNWLNRSMGFTPASTPVQLQVTGLEPGMLMDNFTIERLANETFVLPESSLDALKGDSSQGLWTLEVWDNRVGATNPATQLISWQLRFILQTNSPQITPLFDRVPVTNSVPPCQLAYYYVDVPPWAVYVTNRLLFADAPVNVWFNQTTPPDYNGTNGGTIDLFGGATMTNSRVISVDTTNFPGPPLLPGQRYYLAVQTPCPFTTNVTYAIEVDFGVQFIRLTNMVPYATTNIGVTNGPDYYIYTVTTNAARAQFEINSFLSGNMTLVARKGLPPPGLATFDYISTNAGLNDELIVVITNSTPVPLTAGDWFLTAINNSAGPVFYQIMASEWPVTGRPFSITNVVATTNGICITWEALDGAHYFIQAIPNLNGTDWYAASFTLTETATNGYLTHCVPLPSPFQFFRIVEDLSLLDVPQPAPTLVWTTLINSNQFSGVQFNWFDSVTARYHIEWTPALNDPVTWNSFTNIVTSPLSGFFQDLDDGTQTGGLIGPTFYRASQIIVP